MLAQSLLTTLSTSEQEMERMRLERDAWRALCNAYRHPKHVGAKRARRVLEKLGVDMSTTGPIVLPGRVTPKPIVCSSPSNKDPTPDR